MAKRQQRDAREAMSKVDTAWLRMERPTNRMMITGVMMFDAPLPIARFRRLIAQRFLAFRRFRQRAVDTPGGAYWQDAPALDLAWHVRGVRLPAPAGKRQLQDLVSTLASEPLDHDRPLWQFHVVERYGGGSALITRIHHCYADGIALVQVLLSLTDTAPRAESRAALSRSWLKEQGKAVSERLLEPAKGGLEQALALGGKALEKGRQLVADPALVARLALEGGEIMRELAVALTLPDDPPTRLKGTLGARKRAAWGEPLPLGEVKAVGKALGCTVNDVLLACAAGALRGYLRDRGDAIDGITIRATVPVNLRPLEHAKKLGNHFGLVFLDLPVGEPNPLRRLERVAASMRELKRSRQAIVAFGLLAALGMGPSALQQPALEMFSRKATAVATNVPGPQMPLYLAGTRIREQMFWVPQTGSIGLGISILSFDGAVHFGLIADAALMPDPERAIQRFAQEFEKLVLIMLMEDWDGEITPADAAATLGRFAAAAPEPRRVPSQRGRARKPRANKPGSGFADEMRRFRQRVAKASAPT